MSEKNTSQFIIYQSEDGKTRLDVRFMAETVWLTQALMAQLFSTSKQNISLHLKNIFSEQELTENSVVKDFLTTAADGKQYATKHYNLDAIIHSFPHTTWKRGRKEQQKSSASPNPCR